MSQIKVHQKQTCSIISFKIIRKISRVCLAFAKRWKVCWKRLHCLHSVTKALPPKVRCWHSICNVESDRKWSWLSARTASRRWATSSQATARRTNSASRRPPCARREWFCTISESGRGKASASTPPHTWLWTFSV